MVNPRSLGKDIKKRIAAMKREVRALSVAYRDPRMPVKAKVFAALALAYTLSPIDLIPDFIPVLGYLDDLLILPLLIGLAVRAVPRELMQESRLRVDETLVSGGMGSRLFAAAVVVLWVLILCLIVYGIAHSIKQ